VTFAVVYSFVIAGFYVLVALTEFANSYWFYTAPSDVYDFAGSHLLWWGIFDTAMAALFVIAGFSLLRRGLFGFFVTLTAAGISAMRWLFYIPHDPWLSISAIAIDGLVIWGLCSSMDYFTEDAGY
jgi:hypothetical protein